MRITYGSKKKDGSKRYYYECDLKASSSRARCNSKNANGAKLDAYVINQLKGLTANKGLLIKQLEEFKHHSAKNNEPKDNIKTLEKK